ncbi:MAG: hypothetical protein ABIG43_03105 [Chloroflexota bacterium]
MSDDFKDFFDLDDLDQELRSKSKNRAFIIAMSLIALILLIGLGGMALWVRMDLDNINLAQPFLQTTTISDGTLLTPQTEIAERAVIQFPTKTPQAVESQLISTAEVTESAADDLGVKEEQDALQTEQALNAAKTATVSALLTERAMLQAAPKEVPTMLTETGLMEDFGLPILVGSAVLLVALIIVARRLRDSTSRQK